MSLVDKLKAMFSGGSGSDDGHDHSHTEHEGHAHGDGIVGDVRVPPAAPLDSLGTSMPEASSVPTSIPPAVGSDDENP